MRARWLGLRRRFVATLLERGHERLLARLVGAYILVRRGRRCAVRIEGPLWVHEYRDATLVNLAPGGLPPDRLRERVSDELFAGEWPGAGELVIDGGAGIGEETLPLARAVGPEGHVIAIEAHPRTFRALERMCELNGLTNVTCIEAALAAADGELTLADDPDDLANTVAAGGPLTVRARALDSLAGELALGQIGLLKLNIEGAERDAVLGMGRVLISARRAVVACHDFRGETFAGAETVRAALEAAGFRVRRRVCDPRPWVRDVLDGRRR